MDIDSFQGKQPTLLLERYFEGQAEGWGVMQSRFGALLKEFSIHAEGRFDPERNLLSLKETYRFSDGKLEVLDWSIAKLSDNQYRGEEKLVDGLAEGEQAGNAFHWRYSRTMPSQGNATYTFDDWFWLQDGGVLICRASVRKFGIEVATMSVFYKKVSRPASSKS